jgi:hypothetical protein
LKGFFKCKIKHFILNCIFLLSKIIFKLVAPTDFRSLVFLCILMYTYLSLCYKWVELLMESTNNNMINYILLQSTELTDADLNPQFVQIQTLTKGQTFVSSYLGQGPLIYDIHYRRERLDIGAYWSRGVLTREGAQDMRHVWTW